MSSKKKIKGNELALETKVGKGQSRRSDSSCTPLFVRSSREATFCGVCGRGCVGVYDTVHSGERIHEALKFQIKCMTPCIVRSQNSQ